MSRIHSSHCYKYSHRHVEQVSAPMDDRCRIRSPCVLSDTVREWTKEAEEVHSRWRSTMWVVLHSSWKETETKKNLETHINSVLILSLALLEYYRKYYLFFFLPFWLFVFFQIGEIDYFLERSNRQLSWTRTSRSFGKLTNYVQDDVRNLK